MLKPIYYPLEKAAHKLAITKEELVHHAKLGRIKIVIPKTDNLVFWIETVEPETNKLLIELKGEVWLNWLWFNRRYLEEDINYGADSPDGAALAIHKTSLKDIEAGYDEEDLVFYLRRSKHGGFTERVKLRNPCTEKPLLIKEAKLFVLAKDLEQFEQSQKPWLLNDDRDKPAATEDWHIAARYFYRHHKKTDSNLLKKDIVKLIPEDLKRVKLFKRGGKELPSEAAIEKILQNIEL